MKVTISTKYQIVIPKAVRRQLGLRPGQKMEISNVTDTALTVSKPLSADELVEHYAGIMTDTPWQVANIDAAEWLRKQRDAERW